MTHRNRVLPTLSLLLVASCAAPPASKTLSVDGSRSVPNGAMSTSGRTLLEEGAAVLPTQPDLRAYGMGQAIGNLTDAGATLETDNRWSFSMSIGQEPGKPPSGTFVISHSTLVFKPDGTPKLDAHGKPIRKNKTLFGVVTAGSITRRETGGGTAHFEGRLSGPNATLPVPSTNQAITLDLEDSNSTETPDTFSFTLNGKTFTGTVFFGGVRLMRTRSLALGTANNDPANYVFDPQIGLYLDKRDRDAEQPPIVANPQLNFLPAGVAHDEAIEVIRPDPVINFREDDPGGLVLSPGSGNNTPPPLTADGGPGDEDTDGTNTNGTNTGLAGNPQHGTNFFSTAFSRAMPAQFSSNGRSCATCHASGTGFALSPQDARSRPESDPLISALMADADPDLVAGSEPWLKLRAVMKDQLRHAGLIRIVIPNPTFAKRQGDNPPFIRVFRAVPTLFNAGSGISNQRVDFNGQPLTSFAMWDGREPSLEHQAGSASIGHAQVGLKGAPAATAEAIRATIDAERISQDIAAFERKQLALPRQLSGVHLDMPVAAARFTGTIFEGAPEIPGDDLELKKRFFRTLKLATPAEERGMRVFAGTPNRPACMVCHNRPETLAGGTMFFADARTSRENSQPRQAPPADMAAMTQAGFAFIFDDDTGEPRQQLPTFTLYLQDSHGQLVPITTPDPGLAGRTGLLKDLHKFKIPQLRGISTLNRFYHDNHEGDLAGVIHHYEDKFPELFTLTTSQREDLLAFLKAL